MRKRVRIQCRDCQKVTVLHFLNGKDETPRLFAAMLSDETKARCRVCGGGVIADVEDDPDSAILG